MGRKGQTDRVGHSYSLGMYEKALPDGMPLEEKMQIAKESGFDHVEFCVDLNEERAARLDWTQEEREHWAETSLRMGVPFTTFSLSLLRRYPLGLEDPDKNAEAFRILEEACRLAVMLRSRVMLVNGYDVYDEPSTPQTRENYFRNLRTASKICAYYGMTVGIENAEKPFCSSISQAAEICRHVPSPYIRVYGDIGNSTIAHGGDAEQVVRDIRSGAGYITAMHLKDSLPGQYRFRDYGEGFVDFDACVRAAGELGVRLFTAEIFCDEGRDCREYAAFVARFLRSYLDRYL